MIKVSVLYPNKPGSRFDANYYLTVHMPLSVKLLGPAMKSVTAEIGISGGMPDQSAPYAAIAAFTCESVKAFTDAFLPHADELQGDIPNYTDIAPIIQVSELSDFPVAYSVGTIQ
jgi:uncharacterized protein (TIGR02118 family)